MKLWLQFFTILIGFSGLLANSEITPFNCSGTIYIRPNTSQLSWTKAQNICRNANATLPIVDNPDHQTCFISALNNFDANKTYVWMGANSSSSVWKWLDGSTYNGSEMLPVSTYQQTYAYVTQNGGTDFAFNASKPTEEHPYICRYSSSGYSNCTIGMNTTVILPKNGCYVIIYTEELSWFSARNKCRSNGGDLASFPDASTLNKTIFTLSFNQSYWIGLRSSFWNWIDVVTGLKMDVTYTLWSDDQPDGVGGDPQCLSTDNGTDGEYTSWRDFNCSTEEAFICQLTAPLSSSSTEAISKFSTSSLTTAGISTSGHVATGNQSNLQNTDGNSKNVTVVTVLSSSTKVVTVLSSSAKAISKFTTSSLTSAGISTSGHVATGNQNNHQNTDGNSQNDGGNIALGVGIGVGVGVPVLIAVIAVGACLCCRHRKSSQQSRAIPKNPQTSSPRDVTSFQSSNSEYAEISKLQGPNDSNTTSEYSNSAIQNTTEYVPLEIISNNSN